MGMALSQVLQRPATLGRGTTPHNHSPDSSPSQPTINLPHVLLHIVGPLTKQKVNPGSLADNAGLVDCGRVTLCCKNRPSGELEHEHAKQEIDASGNTAGNTVILVVQRGIITYIKNLKYLSQSM